MTEIANTPELRFPNYENSWFSYKLNDISERVTRKNKNLESQRPLTISGQLGLIDQIEYFNKSVSSKNLTGYTLIKKGEFAYNKSYSNGYPLGAIKKLERYDLGILSSLYICFSFDENIDKSFMKNYFESTKWYREVANIAVEGARNHGLLNIPVNDFFNININLPIQYEQEKIGEFFSKLDRQIELEEQKLAKLEEQKKGYMQKIFSQEIRFKDDNGNDYPEWESKKFLDIFKLAPSKNNQIKSSEVVENGIIPVVDQGKDIFLGYSNEKDKAIEDFDNVIVYGDHTTIIKYIKEPFIIGGDGVKLLKSNDGSLIHYLYILLQYFNVKPEGYKRHYSILKNKMMNISNTKEEQEKIGDFFNELDELIEKQSSKIVVLKQRKKGFLQKMFV
ncbi:TPA: restriction endonuclease subunit S [Staphylococcus aureus]|nr:restriction endonuclease subunit S [Staphylococcus aureus]